MAERSAIFRFDANPTIGGGHAVRCLTLADALEQLGWTCRFAVNPDAPDTVSALAPLSAQCLDPDAIADGGPLGVIIVDHYGLDGADETPWRDAASHIVVLDDLANRRHDCDLLIDQGLGRKAADYQGLVPPHCRLLLGPLHGLLRPEFAARRANVLAARRSRVVNRVLIAFGLSDPDNLTIRALQGLVGKGLHIDVVLGAGAPHLDEVQAAADDLSPPANVKIDAEDMAAIMADADLAIGAFGTTSWERCALGLPTIGVIAADNQEANAETLSAAGAAVSLGRQDNVSAADFAAALDRPVDLADQSRRAAQICDGLGAARVAGAITDMVDGRAPVLRKAAMADADMLLLWRNDPETRRQSKTTEPVARDGHVAWLDGVLADAKRDLRIAEVAGRPVGSVRADRIGEAWVLSWMVAPEARGEGHGRRIVARMVEEFDGEIRAEVRIGNPASARIAAGVGMQLKDEADGLTIWTMRK